MPETASWLPSVLLLSLLHAIGTMAIASATATRSKKWDSFRDMASLRNGLSEGNHSPSHRLVHREVSRFHRRRGSAILPTRRLPVSAARACGPSHPAGGRSPIATWGAPTGRPHHGRGRGRRAAGDAPAPPARA